MATASELFEARHYPGVVALITDALESEPDCVPLLLVRARAHIALRRDLDAQTDLRDIIRLDPQCSLAYRLLGEIAARRDENESAAIFFSEALRLDPDDLEADTWLAIVQATARPAAVASNLPAPAAAAGRFPSQHPRFAKGTAAPDDDEERTAPFFGMRTPSSGAPIHVAPETSKPFARIALPREKSAPHAMPHAAQGDGSARRDSHALVRSSYPQHAATHTIPQRGRAAMHEPSAQRERSAPHTMPRAGAQRERSAPHTVPRQGAAPARPPSSPPATIERPTQRRVPSEHSAVARYGPDIQTDRYIEALPPPPEVRFAAGSSPELAPYHAAAAPTIVPAQPIAQARHAGVFQTYPADAERRSQSDIQLDVSSAPHARGSEPSVPNMNVPSLVRPGSEPRVSGLSPLDAAPGEKRTIPGAQPVRRPLSQPSPSSLSSPALAVHSPVPELPGFGDYLVSTGILTRERLRAAQAYQRSMRVQLATAIVTLGLATPQRIEWAAVAHQSQLGRGQ